MKTSLRKHENKFKKTSEHKNRNIYTFQYYAMRWEVGTGIILTELSDYVITIIKISFINRHKKKQV